MEGVSLLVPTGWPRAGLSVLGVCVTKILAGELTQIHEQNYGVYGVRKLWHAAWRAGWDIGRDQVARIMKIAGVKGVCWCCQPVTTRPAPVPDTRRDLVQRCFKAKSPNQLWVGDITYVRTLSGFARSSSIRSPRAGNQQRQRRSY
ncbi:IS3 family transposase [Arcanobacterium phocae]|uniref:IS3 family transposase n=1 Tax=Arcanobacterium phocae TaxID=131112 RepID=UPI00344CBF5B